MLEEASACRSRAAPSKCRAARLPPRTQPADFAAGRSRRGFRTEPRPRGTPPAPAQQNHNRIPTGPKARIESHLGCRTGWTFFLVNLKSVAEGGPDLRETDVRRASDTALVNM